MIIYKASRFQLVFGDAQDGLFPPAVLANVPYPLSKDHEIFRHIAERVPLTSLVLAKQVHGVHGLCVDDVTHAQVCAAPRQEADFLITAMRGVGIGVLTADCLPIAVFDPVNHAIGMAHAGWRGAVGRIGERMLDAMREKFDTQPDHVKVFLGPCAHACCYEVSDDFRSNLAPFSCADKVVQSREAGLFFDQLLFNQLLLQEAGVRPEAISRDYSACTMCNKRFCSYRREGVASCRQLSLIVLT